MARVEIATFLLDFVLHVDVHLREFVEQYGAWVYALLFLIVFVETGLVVMPFLPGDSLLFIVGALCGAGLMNYSLAVPLLIAAAVLGNQTNYTIGSLIGPRVFLWEQSRLFNKPRSSAPTRSTRSTEASRWWRRASCRSCARSRPSSRAWRR